MSGLDEEDSTAVTGSQVDQKALRGAVDALHQASFDSTQTNESFQQFAAEQCRRILSMLGS